MHLQDAFWVQVLLRVLVFSFLADRQFDQLPPPSLFLSPLSLSLSLSVFLPRSSLSLCATSLTTTRSVLLSVCQMHALQCMGKSYTVTEDGACEWPARANTTGCTGCHMWETCDGTAGQSWNRVLSHNSAAYLLILLPLTSPCRCNQPVSLPGLCGLHGRRNASVCPRGWGRDRREPDHEWMWSGAEALQGREGVCCQHSALYGLKTHNETLLWRHSCEATPTELLCTVLLHLFLLYW